MRSTIGPASSCTWSESAEGASGGPKVYDAVGSPRLADSSTGELPRLAQPPRMTVTSNRALLVGLPRDWSSRR
jgi:hypothetical protein